jgi:hypothetical protein
MSALAFQLKRYTELLGKQDHCRKQAIAQIESDQVA